MSNGVKFPKTLLEATKLFSDEENAWLFAVNLRWPEGITCPFCQGKEHSFIATRKTWQCKLCGKQFSVKKASIFEGSPLPLEKWLIGMWLICNAKNGISSYELHRSLGITQKSAWFLAHRIRLAMQNGTMEKLSGEVEIDETYFGPKKVPGSKPGRGASRKTPIVGAVERGGRITVMVTDNVSQKALTPFATSNISATATVYTDEWSGYGKLSLNGFTHRTINHKTGLYVDGDIHTQNIEAFWSLLKRSIKGTYVSVEPFHLSRYLDEYSFRFNNRKGKDGDRFVTALTSVAGKRVTYKELTGKVLAAGAF